MLLVLKISPITVLKSIIMSSNLYILLQIQRVSQIIQVAILLCEFYEYRLS